MEDQATKINGTSKLDCHWRHKTEPITSRKTLDKHSFYYMSFRQIARQGNMDLGPELTNSKGRRGSYRSSCETYFSVQSEISDASRDAIEEWYITSWNAAFSMVFLRSCFAFSSVKQPRANLDLGLPAWGSGSGWFLNVPAGASM